MVFNIDAVINAKIYGNGGSSGGSSGGGITLPTLANPATADQILEGFEAIDGSGNKLTGTHVCESGGGGVGVAPMIDHGYGSATFVLGSDVTIPAGGSASRVQPNNSTLDGANSPGGFGYIYGHPEITAQRGYGSKYGQYLVSVWNSSATDFTLKAGETYTLVYLYNAK